MKKLFLGLLLLMLLVPSLGLAQTNYTYNHLGQRVSKTNNGTTTVYPHQNYHTDGNTETTYIYANGERMATITDGVITYNHTDHLNSSTITTDASGNVVQVIDHYPFGDERLNEGTHQSHRTFTDHISDSETDLLYMNARYYDDETRKFLSQDPASFDNPERFLHDPQQLNSYSYVGNNPLKYVDPSGESLVHAIRTAGPRLAIGFLGLLGVTTPSWLQGLEGNVSSIDWNFNFNFSKRSEPSIPLPSPLDLQGKSAGEIEDMMGELGLIGEPTRNGDGMRYPVPGKSGDQVRIMPGNPSDPNPVKQGPYGRISKKGTKSDPIPLEGNPTLEDVNETDEPESPTEQN